MSYQVEINTTLLKTKTFFIDEARVVFGETQLICSDIDGFAFGNTQTENRFVKITTHHFKFRSTKGGELKFAFTDALTSGSQRIMNEMTAAIWKCVGQRIAHEMISAISRGQQVPMGGINFSKDGFSYTYKPWFRKERTYHTPWQHILYEINERWHWIELKSSVDKKVLALVPFVGVLNAHALAYILGELKMHPDLLNYLTANKLYLQP